jgi:hypothetical protein
MSATVHPPRFSETPTRPVRPARRFRAGVGISALVLSCLLSSATAASAAPAMSDPAGCTASLAAATRWPGLVADGDGTRHEFSDAFYTHLLSQRVCARLDS